MAILLPTAASPAQPGAALPGEWCEQGQELCRTCTFFCVSCEPHTCPVDLVDLRRVPSLCDDPLSRSLLGSDTLACPFSPILSICLI